MCLRACVCVRENNREKTIERLREKARERQIEVESKSER